MINSRLQALLASYPLKADINLDGRDCDNEEVEQICKVAIEEKQCQKLQLENNKITGKGATTLADALFANNTLIQLSLSYNPIGDIGAHALAQVLCIHNWTLTWLDINGTGITDDGIEYLAEMLKVNKSLILLGLRSNQISDRGLINLTSAIGCFNEHLQWLHLDSNHRITDVSVISFVDMFGHNRSLQAVSIKDCSFTSNGIRELKNAVRTKKNFFLEV
jgi:Ran GTPase-activating protein (RanGAP) involved in mRNA processing and transport